ncbi:hypothetical protein LINGRAHAP2_LOCUS32696, partial [Linum grandiflorum]
MHLNSSIPDFLTVNQLKNGAGISRTRLSLREGKMLSVISSAGAFCKLEFQSNRYYRIGSSTHVKRSFLPGCNVLRIE